MCIFLLFLTNNILSNKIGGNMKATGIVRKIDELGRIVIPKEIRKTMRIREGEALEIFVDKNEEIILKRYDPLSNLKNQLEVFVESLEKNTGFIVAITDVKSIVAVSSKGKKEYLGKLLSKECIHVISRRNFWSTKDKSIIPIIENKGKENMYSQAISPIISDSDLIGSVLLLSDDPKKVIGMGDIKLLDITSNILSQLMQ